MDVVLIKPAEAFTAIGVGLTKGYELINEGELKAVKIGRSTRITVDSVREFVARRLAA